MEITEFATLFTIQSLDRAIGEAKQQITTQEKRIQALNGQIEFKRDELSEINTKFTVQKQELQQAERELVAVELKLAKSREHLTASTGQAMADAAEREASQLSNKQQDLEQQVLRGMENIENLQIEISTTQEFIAGATISSQEIASDVATEIERENGVINGLQERIENNLEELSPSLQEIFKSINKKYRFKRPLAVVEEGCCSECGMGVSESLRAKVNQGSTLELCGPCGRILAPHPEKTFKPAH